MDFIHGQETLTSLQWILRAIVSFFFLLLATKVMGRRSISQLRLIDFTIALIIGNILAHPLSDEGLGLKGSILTTSVLIILYLFVTFVSLKWNRLGNWLEPASFPLMKDGEILYKGLAKARISINYLLSEARKSKIEKIHHVSLALWEPDGTISFFVSPQLQPLTAEDMQLVTKPFSFPQTIIKEGKINLNELHLAHKDITWLENKMLTLNVDVQDVLLGTIDQDELRVYLYD